MSQWFKYDGEKACTISPKGFGREDTTCCSVEFRYNANESSPLDITDIVSAGTSNKISKCQKREIKPLYNN